MNKRNYWPLFFIGLFSFVFSMIIWTIYKSVQVPIVEDKSFMKKYQYVDENYNNMINSNIDFLNKYDFQLEINGKVFPLTTDDIKYGQRVIEKYSNHKDNLKLGNNELKVIVSDKKNNQKLATDIDLVVTKSMSDDANVNLKNSNFTNVENTYTTNFELKEPTNWIITGSFKVEDNIGFIFIKTNAK